jgi:hypothetical protein
MHPIVAMRRMKGGFIKTRMGLSPIKGYLKTQGSKLLNEAKSYGKEQAHRLATKAIDKASEALENLSLGEGMKKDYDDEIGGRVRHKRIKPLKFKY